MDAISKGILSVIAVALCAIAFKLYSPGGSFVAPPTRGDFMALREITDPAQRQEAHQRLMKSVPLIQVQGGQIEVSGSVNIDGSVTIDN